MGFISTSRAFLQSQGLVVLGLVASVRLRCRCVAVASPLRRRCVVAVLMSIVSFLQPAGGGARYVSWFLQVGSRSDIWWIHVM